MVLQMVLQYRQRQERGLATTEIRFKLWLEKGGKMAFGEGLCELLTRVENTGSIAGAAAEMGLAYREAWGRLRDAESVLEQPLLVRRAGGLHGGGARLTPFGRSVVNTYSTLKTEFDTCAERLAHTYLR